jgi:hypothetical protein
MTSIEPIHASRNDKKEKPPGLSKGWIFVIGFLLGVIGGAILMS